MHPPVYQDNPKYAPQGYPMNISTRQPYPPYISSATATATRWSTGLCHCCDDPANCLVTCMCPCVTFEQIAEVVNKGSICKPSSNANLHIDSEFLKLKCCLLSDEIFVFGLFMQLVQQVVQFMVCCWVLQVCHACTRASIGQDWEDNMTWKRLLV